VVGEDASVDPDAVELGLEQFGVGDVEQVGHSCLM
jgi:hypothetical protein